MQIVNAHWERINLGVTCTEINVHKDDTPSELDSTLRELKSEYQVLKIPAGKTDMLLLAQKLGFQAIEMSIQLSRSTKKYSLPNIYKRFEPFINIIEADEQNVELVLNEIKNGKLFVTDRVSNDPFFSFEKSGNRYYNWSRDLINKGARLYMAQYNGKSIGFGLNFSKDGNLYDAVLGGVFPEFENKGLGFLAIHSNVMSTISQGGIKITTAVSSNNVPILRLHMLFGFEINEMNYVLFKHLGGIDYDS